MPAYLLATADQFEGTAAADLVSGDVVFKGAVAGVITAQSGFKTGQRYRAQTVGIYRINCVTADTFALDAAVYWDSANKRCTSTSAGNTQIGVAHAVKTNGQTEVQVRLNGAHAPV